MYLSFALGDNDRRHQHGKEFPQRPNMLRGGRRCWCEVQACIRRNIRYAGM
jgi:hypothetical protein